VTSLATPHPEAATWNVNGRMATLLPNRYNRERKVTELGESRSEHSKGTSVTVLIKKICPKKKVRPCQSIRHADMGEGRYVFGMGERGKSEAQNSETERAKADNG